MQETLRMMRGLILEYEKDRDINELLLEYKRTQKTNIIAYLFVSNYRFT